MSIKTYNDRKSEIKLDQNWNKNWIKSDSTYYFNTSNNTLFIFYTKAYANIEINCYWIIIIDEHVLDIAICLLHWSATVVVDHRLKKKIKKNSMHVWMVKIEKVQTYTHSHIIIIVTIYP